MCVRHVSMGPGTAQMQGSLGGGDRPTADFTAKWTELAVPAAPRERAEATGSIWGSAGSGPISWREGAAGVSDRLEGSG